MVSELLGLSGAFLVEFILTFVFILVIVAVTGKKEVLL